jgi:predicted NAD/FAD-dependent oxidoreductase
VAGGGPAPEIGMSHDSDRIGRTSAIEQHAQTIVGVVIAGLIAWIGMTSQSTAIKVAELGTRLEGLAATDRESSRKLDEQLSSLVATAREHERRLAVIEAARVVHAFREAEQSRIDESRAARPQETRR